MIGINLPELGRGKAFFLKENPVEIGHIVESAGVRYLRNCHSSVYEKTAHMTKPEIIQSIYECYPPPECALK